MDIEWLISADPLARQLAVDVLRESIELGYKRDRRLAQMIIEELGLALKRN